MTTTTTMEDRNSKAVRQAVSSLTAAMPNLHAAAELVRSSRSIPVLLSSVDKRVPNSLLSLMLGVPLPDGRRLHWRVRSSNSGLSFLLCEVKMEQADPETRLHLDENLVSAQVAYRDAFDRERQTWIALDSVLDRVITDEETFDGWDAPETKAPRSANDAAMTARAEAERLLRKAEHRARWYVTEERYAHIIHAQQAQDTALASGINTSQTFEALQQAEIQHGPGEVFGELAHMIIVLDAPVSDCERLTPSPDDPDVARFKYGFTVLCLGRS